MTAIASEPELLPGKSPADRSDVLRLCLLVTASVLLNTLIGAIVGEKTSFLYKDVLQLTPTQTTELKLLLGLPAYVQPFVGAWTEIIPWLGYHRRTYYFCGVLVAILGYVTLALLHEYHYGAVVGLLLALGSGGVLASVVYNAAFVAVGNRSGTLPRLQSLAMLLPLLLSTFYSSHLGGYVAEHWTYPRAYGTAAILALLLLPLILLMDDTRVPHGAAARLSEEAMQAHRERRAQSFAILKQALKSRELWIFTAYIAYIALTPSPDTARFYYEVDSLHFSKQFIGDLGMYGAVGALAGLGLITLLARFVSLRMATWYSWIGNCAIYLCYFGIRDPVSAKIAFTFMGLSGSLYGVTNVALLGRACPRGAEATVYGLLGSATALFYLICDYAGTKLYDIFGPKNPAHHYTVAYGWNMSVAIGLAFAVVQVGFLPFLPAWTRSSASISARRAEEALEASTV
ncbi:MAG TPA: MFS transporter [Chthonomonadaceae bacterium]|nr:MFS transporter [Chthonomonadaceae bacterium]